MNAPPPDPVPATGEPRPPQDEPVVTLRDRPAPAVLLRAPPGPATVVLRMLVLVAAIAAVGIVHVWSHTRVTAAGYRLGELQRTQESLRAQRNRLEVEVATLRAPGRLEEFARTRLKMAPPAPGAVVAGRVGGTAPGRVGTPRDRELVRTAPAEPLAMTANVR